MNTNFKEKMYEHFDNSPVYQLYDVIDKRVDLRVMLSIFYILEGMLVTLNNDYLDFHHTAQQLKKEVQEYFDYITSILAQMMNEYTYLACFSELRYMGFEISHYNIALSNDIFNGINIQNRNAYAINCKKAYEYSQYSIEAVSKLIFGRIKWNKEYGGYSWRKIANVFSMYGSVPNSVFIDYCFDTQHNNGCYLDKNCGIFNPNITDLTDLLNRKKLCDIINFIFQASAWLDYKTLKLSIRFIQLIANLKSIYEPKKPLKEKNKLYNIIKGAGGFGASLILITDRLKEYAIGGYSNNRVFQNNLEVFKLSLYTPGVFGDKDMAKFVDLEFIPIQEKISARQFLVNPAKYPQFVKVLLPENSYKTGYRYWDDENDEDDNIYRDEEDRYED